MKLTPELLAAMARVRRTGCQEEVAVDGVRVFLAPKRDDAVTVNIVAGMSFATETEYLIVGVDVGEG